MLTKELPEEMPDLRKNSADAMRVKVMPDVDKFNAQRDAGFKKEQHRCGF